MMFTDDSGHCSYSAMICLVFFQSLFRRYPVGSVYCVCVTECYNSGKVTHSANTWLVVEESTLPEHDTDTLKMTDSHTQSLQCACSSVNIAAVVFWTTPKIMDMVY